MTIDNESERPREDDRRVLAGLASLSAEIDRRRYPGTAWPARRRMRRLLWPALAAAAAAAALLAALGLYHLFHRGGTRPPQPATEAKAAAPTVEEWNVPTDFSPAVTGQISFDLPTLSLPSAEEAGQLPWNMPSVSLPSTDVMSGSDESGASSQPVSDRGRVRWRSLCRARARPTTLS